MGRRFLVKRVVLLEANITARMAPGQDWEVLPLGLSITWAWSLPTRSAGVSMTPSSKDRSSGRRRYRVGAAGHKSSRVIDPGYLTQMLNWLPFIHNHLILVSGKWGFI